MVCEGCAEKIGDSLNLLPGVRDVRSTVAEKRVRVRYEPTNLHSQDLKDAVARAGFTAVDA